MFKQPDQPTFEKPEELTIERRTVYSTPPSYDQPFEIILEKINNRVTLHFGRDIYYREAIYTTFVSSFPAGTIPEGFRPLSDVSIVYAFNYAAASDWMLEVYSDGGMLITSRQVTGSVYRYSYGRTNSITYTV